LACEAFGGAAPDWAAKAFDILVTDTCNTARSQSAPGAFLRLHLMCGSALGSG